MGVYPYNLQIFQQYRLLKKSTIGTIGVIMAMVIVVVLYNFLIYSFSDDDNSLKNSQSKFKRNRCKAIEFECDHKFKAKNR